MFDDMIADIEANEKLSPRSMNCSYEAENPKFHFSLYHNLMLQCLQV